MARSLGPQPLKAAISVNIKQERDGVIVNRDHAPRHRWRSDLDAASARTVVAYSL